MKEGVQSPRRPFRLIFVWLAMQLTAGFSPSSGFAFLSTDDSQIGDISIISVVSSGPSFSRLLVRGAGILQSHQKCSPLHASVNDRCFCGYRVMVAQTMLNFRGVGIVLARKILEGVAGRGGKLEDPASTL
jgi:hypothetical protein